MTRQRVDRARARPEQRVFRCPSAEQGCEFVRLPTARKFLLPPAGSRRSPAGEASVRRSRWTGNRPANGPLTHHHKRAKPGAPHGGPGFLARKGSVIPNEEMAVWDSPLTVGQTAPPRCWLLSDCTGPPPFSIEPPRSTGSPVRHSRALVRRVAERELMAFLQLLESRQSQFSQKRRFERQWKRPRGSPRPLVFGESKPPGSGNA